MEKKSTADCPYPYFFLVMKDGNLVKRRTKVANFFKQLPSQNGAGQVVPISGLWNRAMAHPNDPEYLELGMFECMSLLIWKGIENRDWLSQDQNVYIPYYAAHIIGSYTMNVDEFAERAIQAGVISPLLELLRGRLTWVEQRVAVRALGHLATYDSTFPYLAEHEEILDVSMNLAMESLDNVYTRFLQFVDRRKGYHCDLLTRGTGGLEMETRKAEEWASQLQCWSLQLINCFALKSEFLPRICQREFLSKLPGMWGGLVNETSSAGVGLLRTICHQRSGRPPVAGCPVIIEALCNIARSSDDWQCMAIDILVWLLQDPDTRDKVLDRAAVALVDLVELPSLGEHKRVGECITAVLLQDYAPFPCTYVRNVLLPETKDLLDNLAAFRKKLKLERNMPKVDLQIKQAMVLVVKLEGNARFSSGDIAGAAAKYTEALALCPVRAKKERVVLYSNRAQCHLILQNPEEAISDTTRALAIHNPVNRHGKSLWRRAQAYEILGLAKESLLDAIMFVNETCQAPDGYTDFKLKRVPEYVEDFVKKQMEASWLFKEAAIVHGEIQHSSGHSRVEEEVDEGGDEGGNENSEWETASETDTDNGSDMNIKTSEDIWVDSTPNWKPTKVSPAKDSKGVSLQDLFSPHYQRIQHSSGHSRVEEEVDEGGDEGGDEDSEWETASETDTDNGSDMNIKTSKDTWVDSTPDRKPTEVSPAKDSKGVSLQDLFSPHYQRIQHSSGHSRVEEEVDEGGDEGGDEDSEWETASETDTDNGSDMNIKTSKDIWVDRTPNRKPTKVSPAKDSKGVSLQDLFGPLPRFLLNAVPYNKSSSTFNNSGQKMLL